jgi:ATP-binding cassette subfamily A (ABC1) protein 3
MAFPSLACFQYGIGSSVPIASIGDVFDGGLRLVWADGTNGTGVPSPDSIMSYVTSGFTKSQLTAIQQVATPADIPSACPQNFNLFSECFAAVAFNNIPAFGNDTNPINYTIRADGGLGHIDVVGHNSDFERRILPLQWAIDKVSYIPQISNPTKSACKAIIDLKTGTTPPTPLQWPFTQETNEEQFTGIRLSMSQDK